MNPRPFPTRLRRVVAFVLLGLVASCGNLTCDEKKKKSIEHTNRGVEAFNTKADALAEKELEQALVLDPSNHGAAYVLGQVYLRKEEWDKAVDKLSIAVKFSPKDGMYHLKLGEALYKAGSIDMAQTEFEASAKINDNLWRAHYFLGRIFKQREMAKEAAEQLTKACILNPLYGPSFLDLADLYFRWGFYQEAIAVLDNSSNVPDEEDLTDIAYLKGLSYEALNAPDKAITAYEEALKIKPDNQEARLQLGMVYASKNPLTQGDAEVALKHLQEYLKVNGNKKEDINVQIAQQALFRMNSMVPPTPPPQ